MSAANHEVGNVFDTALDEQGWCHLDEKRRELTMWVPCKLRTVNAERAGNTWDHRRYTAEIREFVGWQARGARVGGFSGPVKITVRPVQARGPLGDVGAHYPTVKAAVDGLVDADVLPGDGPDVVVAMLMHAPRKGAGSAGLLLTVVAS